MFARCGAGFFPTVVGADAGRTGVGAGPEAPTPSLFLSANLVRSGRTRSPRARVHCRDRNQQASCHTDPTRTSWPAPTLQARLPVFLTVRLGGVGCSRPRKHWDQWCQRKDGAPPSPLWRNSQKNMGSF